MSFICTFFEKGEDFGPSKQGKKYFLSSIVVLYLNVHN